MGKTTFAKSLEARLRAKGPIPKVRNLNPRAPEIQRRGVRNVTELVILAKSNHGLSPCCLSVMYGKA